MRSKPWTFTMGARYQNSFRHFVGTVEQKQREVLANQIRNKYALFDFGISRQLNERWSVNASIPLLFAHRNQLYNPRGLYDVRSIGDMTIGGRMNVWRPSNERFSNVTVGLSLKLPTGVYNSTGVAVDAAGKEVIATADQSIQAGDGRVGFAMDIQAYRRVWFNSMLYFSGSYLFNPADTNGVYTYRGRATERYMSVADQYLWRAGVARAVPGIRGLTATFGGRIEGVPVRDAFGKSNGFRRPGYAISVDPGLLYAKGDYTYSLNFAWAVERNRRRSVPDIIDGRHGDAAFADWTANLGISRRF